jgi:hypothetical protein
MEPPAETLSHLNMLAEQRRVSAIEPRYDLDRLTLAHERRAAEVHAIVVSQHKFALTAGEPWPGPIVETHGVRLVEQTQLVSVPQPEPDRSKVHLASTFAPESDRMVLYIPNSTGGYSEERTIVQYANLMNPTIAIFCVEDFAFRFPLRFDPCQCSGLISIDSFSIIEARSHRIVWELNGHNASGLVIGGTAVMRDGNPKANGHRKQSFLRAYRRDPDNKPFRLISTGMDPQVVLPPLGDDVNFPLIITVEMKLLPCVVGSTP